MSRAPSTFKETDVKRLLRAIEAAGNKVASVEIDGVKIRIRNGNAAASNNDDNINTNNPWDEVDLK